MMTQTFRSKDQVKNFAEVFTPPQTTFMMGLMPEVRDTLMDVTHKTYDPFVGQGQFPATWLVLRMFYNIDRLDEIFALKALSTLYGNDIQPKSVDECRAHMLATICDAYEFFTGEQFTKIDQAALIIYYNFIVADSAKLWGIDTDDKPKPKKTKAPKIVQPTLF